MKLAKIEHVRCDQPAGKWGISTYVWVPDTWSEADLQQCVSDARESYLKAEHDFKKAAPVTPPGYGASIMPNTPDHLTVGELKAEYEQKAKAYKDYQELQERSRKSFAWHLWLMSDKQIRPFWEQAPELKAECDWGTQPRGNRRIQRNSHQRFSKAARRKRRRGLCLEICIATVSVTAPMETASATATSRARTATRRCTWATCHGHTSRRSVSPARHHGSPRLRS